MITRTSLSSIATLGFLSILAACGGAHGSSFVPPPPSSSVNQYVQADVQSGGIPTPIQHIIIIYQENRTPDYLFQGLPGADISKTAKDSHGHIVALHAVSLAAGYDLGHAHRYFLRDYDHGKLDGFDKGLKQINHLRPFGYAPRSEVYPYLEMATQYVFGDHMFQSNQGPSFPSHMYIIAGRSTDASLKPYVFSENAVNNVTGKVARGGCDSDPKATVATINLKTGAKGPSPFPCFDPVVLSDFLDAKGVSWRYYQKAPGAGLWRAYDAVKHVRYGPDYANVVTPSDQIIDDIKKNKLAGMTWVMPGETWSDHAGPHSTTQGPAWVASIVNAVGQSKFWSHTAIFVTWDDWGGWYDHVPPPVNNAYELGFRVPLLVISPYAKQGYVSKVQHEFGSILAYAEETFGIPKGSLGTTDERADDLQDAFDYTQQPRQFEPIKAPKFLPKINQQWDMAEDP